MEIAILFALILLNGAFGRLPLGCELGPVVDAAGGVAWMSTASLSNQRTVVATANRTELRRSPDAKAALAFSVDKDVVLHMVEPPKNGWVKLRHADGSSGYGQISAFWGL